jgi:hypothetical protein
MIEAKLSMPRRFYWKNSTVALPVDLVFKIYKNDGTLFKQYTQAANQIDQATGFSYIFQTPLVTFTEVGTYYFHWVGTNVDKDSGQFVVLDDPMGDFSTGISRKYRYTAPSYAAGIATLGLKIFDKDGTVKVTSEVTQTAAIVGVYETDDQIMIQDEGVYGFYWEDSASFANNKLETFLVLPTHDTQTVTVFATYQSAGISIAQSGVTVLLSETDGTRVDQDVTDANGRVLLKARNGSYIITLQKDGVVFAVNNVAATIGAADDVNGNKFIIISPPFSASFDDTPLFDIDAKSLMTVDLADIHGNPLQGVSILVSSRLIPDKKTGTNSKTVGIMGASTKVVTNGDGHAETYLLRGTKVEVAFENTTVRRTITVPSQATFALMDLITGDDDPFDVMIPNIQAAVRRSV